MGFRTRLKPSKSPFNIFSKSIGRPGKESRCLPESSARQEQDTWQAASLSIPLALAVETYNQRRLTTAYVPFGVSIKSRKLRHAMLSLHMQTSGLIGYAGSISASFFRISSKQTSMSPRCLFIRFPPLSLIHRGSAMEGTSPGCEDVGNRSKHGTIRFQIAPAVLC